MRTRAVAIAALSALSACAVQQPPTGGPRDTTPPRVVAVFPSEDSTGIPRDVRPTFTFSERIDAESFKNRVLVYPPATFDKLSVSGERLEVRFKSLLPETTICLVLLSGYHDAHRETPSPESRVVCFSTTDSIARGQISGIIYFKTEPDSNGVAELFLVRRDSLTDLATARRARVAFADRGGRFVFRALPADGAHFLLRGFIDKDRDGFFSDAKEFGLLHPDTIVLDPFTDRVEEIRVTVIDPKEPGSIEGTVVIDTAVAPRATVRLDPLRSDARMFWTMADTTGAYLLRSVAPGEYLLSAFIDVNGDTLCGPYLDPADTTVVREEPCVKLPDTIRVKPGERVSLDPIPLR